MKIVTIKTKFDFRKLSINGKKYRLAFATLLCCPTENLGVRIAFAVSKRLGNAVARNRIKRRCRAVFAEAIKDPSINASISCDVLIIATTNSYNFNFKTSVCELVKFLNARFKS